MIQNWELLVLNLGKKFTHVLRRDRLAWRHAQLNTRIHITGREPTNSTGHRGGLGNCWEGSEEPEAVRSPSVWDGKSNPPRTPSTLPSEGRSSMLTAPPVHGR